MFKNITLSLCLIMASAYVFSYNTINAQTPTPTLVPTPISKGSVSGTVTAKKSGKPVKRAKVSLKSKELDFKDKTITDSDGKYLFSDLSAGNYILKVKKQGFKNAKKKIELAEGENEIADVQLKKETGGGGDGDGDGGY
ncbi:MAG: carboxypeptidase regulatory-like domain-containing protein [Candidatus Brocadia sp.]|nr:carboxypeptidase regulatory-like domain-containing protein [Candidatus Brocadia sp.]